MSTIGDWYAEAAEGWVRGASLVYGPLAELLVDRCPIPLAGERVLDLGAGTGVATDAIVARGGHPFALDRSLAMLAWQQEHRPPAAVADASPSSGTAAVLMWRYQSGASNPSDTAIASTRSREGLLLDVA